MIVRVEDIPAEGLDIHFEKKERWWQPEKDKPFLDVELVRPVIAELHLNLIAEKVHIKGEINVVLQLFCSRCLEPFNFPIKATMDFMLVPRWLGPQTEALRLKREDMEVEFFDGVEINIDQAVAEQIFLNVPMKPICKPDCKGLCPICGTNLNKGRCSCGRPRFSPFYEAMQQLKKKVG